MANFTAGTGTIQASSLEAATVVASLMLQNLEQSNTESPDNIAVNYFTGDSTVQIQWNIPITTSIASDGKLLISGNDYVLYPSFAAGGDVKSTQLPSALLEIFQNLQSLEKDAEDPEDPGANNKVQITYDIDNLIGTVTAELPISFDASNGTVVISAVEYLTIFEV